MTGLIYVILIALWGVVLVPRWLHHHDESRRRREAERVERALNPHNARSAAPSAADDEHYQSWREYLKTLTNRERVGGDPARWVDALRAPQGRHARRRRNILLGLTGAVTVSLLGVVAGILPSFLAVLTTLLLVGYVSAMFFQMRQWESGLSTAPAAAAQDFTAEDLAASGRSVRDGVRLVSGTAAVGSEWEPRETTLPTYTSKSKASKIPRRIDLTSAGWNGASMVEQARAQQSPHLQDQFDREFAALAPDADQQVAEFANYANDRSYYRRAVNE